MGPARTSTDFTGFTDRKGLAVFDADQSAITMGNRWADGESSQGQAKIMDPLAEISQTDLSYNVPAHWLSTLTEDTTGCDHWLSRSRIITSEGGRGESKGGTNVEYDVTFEDCNAELAGQAFTEDWVRPEETDYARIVALQAYTLNGTSSTATHHRRYLRGRRHRLAPLPNTNTVTMPAKTYPIGTQPREVIAGLRRDGRQELRGHHPRHAGRGRSPGRCRVLHRWWVTATAPYNAAGATDSDTSTVGLRQLFGAQGARVIAYGATTASLTGTRLLSGRPTVTPEDAWSVTRAGSAPDVAILRSTTLVDDIAPGSPVP